MIAAAVVMVLSVGLPVAAAAARLPASTATPNLTTATSGSSVPKSQHPGTLDIYLNAPGGATTVDPSVAYYTVNYEPILNVYETLVAYNGMSTASFVPVAATCVPGTGQCTTDYGGTGSSIPGFTGINAQDGTVYTGAAGQEPIYWTFVIDPAAHFYDPSTGVGWPVYPSDVMFSMARTLGFATLPSWGAQPGWIIGQSLLPSGPYTNSGWDLTNPEVTTSGMHAPFNNTPYDVLSSMLINDTGYCPAAAMDGVHGDGCITFVANSGYNIITGSQSSGGQGQTATETDWPAFLQFIADNLGASIEPCGWFSARAQGASVPGFPGTSANYGDAGCYLPGSTPGSPVTSTMQTGFENYMASVANNTPGEYSWDTFELNSLHTPSIQPGVMGVMLGSGPYWASVALSTGYGLEPSMSYQQPSGCGGDPTDFPGQYTGYCYPVSDVVSGKLMNMPQNYIENVSVQWNTGDTVGVDDYIAGTADMADIEVAHTSEMLSLQAAGKIWIEKSSGLSVFQQNYVMSYSTAIRSDDDLSGANTIPSDFFSYEAARALLQMAYPFTTIETSVWTVDGLASLQFVGGQIPYLMGCYYAPTTVNGCTNTYTVTWPYEVNGGVPQTSSSDASIVGSAAWWWAQGNNPASAYYDPEFVSCTHSSPCYFSIESTTGNPSQDSANSIWMSSIVAATGGALQPNSPDISAADLLDDCGMATPGYNACPVFNYGWIPDYPDPTDYEAAYGLPNGTYTGPDDNGAMLYVPYSSVTGEGTYSVDPSLCGPTVSLGVGDTGVAAYQALYEANLGTTPNPAIVDVEYWANVANGTLTTPVGIPEACQGNAYTAYTWVTELANSLGASDFRILLYDLGQTIMNGLDFYTWTGQQVAYFTAAPWIAESSINTNVVIGAGDDQFWFMLKYASAVTTTSTTFTETGLGAKIPWTVTVNGGEFSSTKSTLTVTEPSTVTTFSYTVSCGSILYSFSPASGVATAGTPVSITFTAVYSPVTFKETGLPAGTAWSVTVGGSTYGGTAPAKGAGTIVVNLPSGTAVPYTAQSSGWFQVSKTIATIAPPRPVTVPVKFTPYNAWGVSFSATVGGVAWSTGTWSVVLKVTAVAKVTLPPKPGSMKSTTAVPATITWTTGLTNGTYTFTAKAKGYTTVTGTFTVVNGVITYQGATVTVIPVAFVKK